MRGRFPNPYNSRLNFVGGAAVLAFGQVLLLRAWSAGFDALLVAVPYVLVNVAGLLLLALTVDRLGLAGDRLRTVRRVAGVLFAVGMLSWSVLEYLLDPGPRTVFYVLRWVVPAVLLAAVFFYGGGE